MKQLTAMRNGVERPGGKGITNDCCNTKIRDFEEMVNRNELEQSFVRNPRKFEGLDCSL
jgi:cell fate regulator YaaT (PSP1 superfamily)